MSRIPRSGGLSISPYERRGQHNVRDGDVEAVYEGGKEGKA